MPSRQTSPQPKPNALSVVSLVGDASAPLLYEILSQLRPTISQAVSELDDIEDAVRASSANLVLLGRDAVPQSGAEMIARLAADMPAVALVVLAAAEQPDDLSDWYRAGLQLALSHVDAASGRIHDLISQAVWRQHRNAVLSEQGLLDQLTDVYNRAGFVRTASKLLRLADRLPTNVLVLYCDIDGLKAVNDDHGHAVGDDALRAVARTLRSTFRASDVVGRLGGDEFAVAAPQCPGVAAGRLIARIQRRLSDWPSGRARLGLSIGAAEYVPKSGESVEDVLRRADMAQYACKAHRWRV